MPNSDYFNQIQKKHSIRLNGPWQAEVVRCESNERVGLKRKVHIPSDWADWLGRGFYGTVSYSRQFGCPTNLHEDQRVWLVIEGADFVGHVWLNDTPIADLKLGMRPSAIEIGRDLLVRNVLRIDISVAADDNRPRRSAMAGGLIGEVRLEIEE